MRNITELYNPSVNFWDILPQFLLIEPFTTFHKNDKSRSKVISSTTMWAIALLLHPRSDIYYVKDKFEQVARTMMDKPDLDWEKYREHMDAFVDAALTQGEKSLVAQEERLKNRDAFLREQSYSFDYYNDQGRIVKGTADQLDAMEARTPKLYDNYFNIQKTLEEEKNAASQKGSKIESLSDSGAM